MRRRKLLTSALAAFAVASAAWPADATAGQTCTASPPGGWGILADAITIQRRIGSAHPKAECVAIDWPDDAKPVHVYEEHEPDRFGLWIMAAGAIDDECHALRTFVLYSSPDLANAKSKAQERVVRSVRRAFYLRGLK